VWQQPDQFGRELRRRRLDAGLTLSDLSDRVHYSKAQLSKVERGLKPASRELARLCDTALAAQGALTGLGPERPRHSLLTGGTGGTENEGGTENGSGTGTAGLAGITGMTATADEGVWEMGLSVNGQRRFHSTGRRQVIAAGAVSMLALGAGPAAAASAEVGGSLLQISRSLFDQYRRLGQSVGPEFLLPALIAQTHTLRELSAGAGTRTRESLLRLGSRYAEYVGWLVQETGDDQGALWWTERAVTLAAAGGDHDLAAYALVRRALVTLYHGDGPRTVGLAQQAQAGGLPPRIRGLAAQREAQGHALSGEYDACMRSLDRAGALLARDAPDSDEPVIGTRNLPDTVAMITGWCLYDLGRPREAAEAMDRQLAQVPTDALRTQVRYGLRRALAYASAGDIDHACHLTRELLSSAAQVHSATITADLRQLARTLGRHPRNAAVRDLAPELGACLPHSSS
jgi:tetratricopeptide (TPR) repeat protein